MFHHFHNENHLPAQGSLSSSDFIEMIEWLNANYSLINASEYEQKFQNKTLKSDDICLSFDDGLKCQYDIVVPVLRKFGLDAFFFIYSSIFTNNPDPLEIYRYFRTTEFGEIDDFYDQFNQAVKIKSSSNYLNHHSKYKKANYLSEFHFYTENDKWFRYLRDQYLTKDQYDEIMQNLMLQKSFDANKAKKDLWVSEQNLVDIDNQGHIIGLHSHTHPTKMSKLTRAQQLFEYQKNYEQLTQLIGKPIKAMSHPCGDYNENTLNILSELKITIGFRSNMSVQSIQSRFEIPREDHANILKRMNK